MEGYWAFLGGGSQKTKFLKDIMELNWNFQRVGGGTKKPLVGGVWIFSGTTQLHTCKKEFAILSYQFLRSQKQLDSRVKEKPRVNAESASNH